MSLRLRGKEEVGDNNKVLSFPQNDEISSSFRDLRSSNSVPVDRFPAPKSSPSAVGPSLSTSKDVPGKDLRRECFLISPTDRDPW